jgi:hypothetical protein
MQVEDVGSEVPDGSDQFTTGSHIRSWVDVPLDRPPGPCLDTERFHGIGECRGPLDQQSDFVTSGDKPLEEDSHVFLRAADFATRDREEDPHRARR